MKPTNVIRQVNSLDADAILDIYSHYVLNTVISFETSLPSTNEMNNRIDKCIKSYPWIVYERDGKVIGYAYASRFRERKAYDYSSETTVYVHKEYTGQGIGKALYGQLIEELKLTNIAVLVGCIALPNEKSVSLHESFGFRKIAVFTGSGRKFNNWIDVGFWELKIKNLLEYNPECDG